MHLLRTELNHHEVTVQLSVKIQLLTFLSASCILVGSLCEGFVSVHSASCVLKSVGSLCEGFVSVHSASCVLVSSLCEGFVSVHSASVYLAV